MIELTKAYSNAEQEISKNTTWNVLGMHAYNIHESMFSSTTTELLPSCPVSGLQKMYVS